MITALVILVSLAIGFAGGWLYFREELRAAGSELRTLRHSLDRATDDLSRDVRRNS